MCNAAQPTWYGSASWRYVSWGIWPNTPSDQSPTIWKADEETVCQAEEVGSVPGRTTDVPEHETAIRPPANMLQFIPDPMERGHVATPVRESLARSRRAASR